MKEETGSLREKIAVLQTKAGETEESYSQKERELSRCHAEMTQKINDAIELQQTRVRALERGHSEERQSWERALSEREAKCTELEAGLKSVQKQMQ